MKRNVRYATGVSSYITVMVSTLVMAENTEILKITVGKATKLIHMSHQNTSEVMASRTGVVAVFYPKPPRGVKKYRVSTDAGLT